MRHLLDKHTPIIIALETILGSFGGNIGVRPVSFFGEAPLAAAEGRRVRYRPTIIGQRASIL